MTCIVGVVHEGTVLLGGDSCDSTEYVHRTTAIPKVWVQDRFVFGVCGSPTLRNLLEFVVKLPPILTDAGYYMAAEFVPELRRVFSETGNLGKNSDGYDLMDGGLLVGVNGRLFRIGERMTVQESATGYDACGMGAEVAMGSLYTSDRLEPIPVERIALALSAAVTHSKDVTPPFEVVMGGRLPENN